MTAGASAQADAARRSAVAHDLAAQLRRVAVELDVDDVSVFPLADLVLIASQCLELAALASPPTAAALLDLAWAASDLMPEG